MFVFNKKISHFLTAQFFLELYKLILNCTICVELHVKINPEFNPVLFCMIFNKIPKYMQNKSR